MVKQEEISYLHLMTIMMIMFPPAIPIGDSTLCQEGEPYSLVVPKAAGSHREWWEHRGYTEGIGEKLCEGNRSLSGKL